MHTCPECGQACSCNGDIDDCMDICDDDADNCIHDYGPEDDEVFVFGCCYPDECCMPGLHMLSECHTAADAEAQHEEHDQSADDALSISREATGMSMRVYRVVTERDGGTTKAHGKVTTEVVTEDFWYAAKTMQEVWDAIEWLRIDPERTLIALVEEAPAITVIDNDLPQQTPS